MKLSILTSQPIHHQVPLFRVIHEDKNINLKVYFKRILEKDEAVFNDQFGKKIKLGVPLLDGYNYKEISSLFNISYKLKNDNPDALLIYSWSSLIDWIAIFSAIFLKVPIMIRSESPLNQEAKKKGIKQKIKKFLLKKLFKNISAFLYIGKQNKKFYKSYGVSENKLFFTPYAVDNKRFRKSAKKLKENRENFRKELNIKNNDVAILFVGKYIKKKRPLDLIKAFKNLQSQNINKNIHLIFVGEGLLKKKMENYIESENLKNVNLVGFKNQIELPKFYSMSDIFVLPSGVGETWGLVVNEAMNFKLPVVVSNVPGSGYDLVHNEKNGYRYSVGDINALSKKLKILIENDKKRKEFGKNSFEIVKNYSYKEDLKGIKESLNSII